MSGLKFSFSKPKAAAKTPVDTKKPAFDDSEDEDNILSKAPQKKKQPEAIVGLNEDLRTYTSLSEETAARMAKEALEADPSVFDYDAVYDELKVAEKQKKQLAELDRQERKPKYMDNLIASAEVRKRDYLIAQEKKYKKERETEGEEFAGKEKFVTSAYKKQQEEMRKAEEEERLREENARKKSHGMASFYRNLLEEEEEKHDLAVKAATKAVVEGKTKPISETEVETPREKKLADEARKLNAELGAEAILLNDEGEVVDKRQLLKGGLNILPKAKPVQAGQSEYQKEYEARKAAQRDKYKEREARERQTRVIAEQYEMKRKRAAEEDAEKEQELALRAKSKKTSDEVMGARERYLARKKAAAAQAV